MFRRWRLDRRQFLRIGAAAVGSGGLRAQATDPGQGYPVTEFWEGINYPWAAYGHDFGDNAWGYDGLGSAGWTYQTWFDTQGLVDVCQSSEQAHTGGHSLRVTAELLGQDPQRSQGEVHIDLVTHPPADISVPLNLEDGSVECWIHLPPGSAGPEPARSTLQLFLKSQNWASFYSPPWPIQPEWEGVWIQIAASLSDRLASRDDTFDATTVRVAGVKIAIPSNSAAELKSPVYLDDFVLRGAATVTFDFEQLEIERDLAHLRQVFGDPIRKALRIFIFADGRASPEFGANGETTGFDRHFFPDFEALLAAAARCNFRVIPVLTDFLWCDWPRLVSGAILGGHADIVRQPHKRQEFLDRVLAPLIERYRDHNAILAWEVMNEPEWAMRGISGGATLVGDAVSISEMQEFVRLCTQTIHDISGQKVTVGSARRRWLQYWAGLGLDLYQFHWYDHFAGQEPFPWAPGTALGLDRPCLVGEVPTADTTHSAMEFLSAAYEGGYAGLLPWSYRANDQASSFSRVTSDLQAWCTTLYFPFYQADQDSFTGFAVTNTSDRSVTLEFVAFGPEGTLLGFDANPARIELGAKRQLARLGSEIFEAAPSQAQSGWVRLRPHSAEVAGFFQFGRLGELDGSVAFTTQSKHLFFTRVFEGPDAFRGQEAVTFLSIANPNEHEIRLELKWFGGQGGVEPLSLTSRIIPACGCLYESMSELFDWPLSFSGGYVAVDVTQGDGAAGFQLIRLQAHHTAIGLNAWLEASKSEFYSAQLASLPGFYTSLKLVNTDREARSVALSAVDDGGAPLADQVTLTLGAGVQLERDVGELFGFDPQRVVVGSLRVQADGPGIVGDVLFGDGVGFVQAAALPLQTGRFTHAVFSQVANQTSFYTGIALYNPGPSPAEVSLQVFSEEGAPTGHTSRHMEAGTRWARLLVELMPSTAGQLRGYVVIDSTQPVVAQQLFGSPELLSAVPPNFAR